MGGEGVIGPRLASAAGVDSASNVNIARSQRNWSRRRMRANLGIPCLFLCFAVLTLTNAAVAGRSQHGLPQLPSALARQSEPEQPVIDEPPTPPPTEAPKASTAASGTNEGTSRTENSGGSSDSSADGSEQTDHEGPEYIKPTLEECGPALRRMQVLLLLFLVFEIFAALVACILSHDKSAKKLLRRWSSTILLVYVIPVVLLSLSIIWLGSAPTGSCLNYHTEVRLTFALLLLYMVFKIVQAIIAVTRSKLWRSFREKDGERKNGEESQRGGTAPKPQSNWGRGDRDDGVPPGSPSEEYTMMYDYQSQEPPKWDCTCCGLFRFVP